MNTNDPMTIVDIVRQASKKEAYSNIPLTFLNDHVVRMSVMTEPYYWHFHPDSDESFLVIEGIVLIDFADRTIELHPYQLYTIPKNIHHRTRPGGNRSVNITFEKATITTVKVARQEE